MVLNAQLIFLASLPLLVALAASIAAWDTLQSPWLFLVSSLLGLYVLYGLIAITWTLFPTFGGYFLETRSSMADGQSATTATSILRLYVQPLLVFAALCMPTLWLLLRHFRQ